MPHHSPSAPAVRARSVRGGGDWRSRFRFDESRRLSLLEVDPELGEGLDPAELAEAARFCTVGVAKVAAGRITSWPAPARGRGGPPGVIVLRGLISRRLFVEGRHAVELLGPGDYMRPSRLCSEAVTAEARWKVLDPAVLAVLDERFFQGATRCPALLVALLDRSARRSDSLLVRLAIAEVPQAATRVRLVLWHLAERWGQAAPGGVLLPLRLSRTTLADLVCARRETISRALSTLADHDLVRAHEHGVLLTGQSPAAGQTAPGAEPSRARKA